MSNIADSVCHDEERGRSFRVMVLVEPWESWMASELSLEARDHSQKNQKKLAHTVEPIGSGIFSLNFDFGAEVKQVFASGNAEIRVTDRKARVLGRRRIASYRGAGPIAVKVPVVRPSSDRVPKRRLAFSNAIITSATVRQLAGNLAKLQNVGIRQARVPHGIAQAIRELNQLAEVAARSRTGDKVAEELLRTTLGASAFTSPGGVRGTGGIGARSEEGIFDSLGELGAGKLCGPALSRAASVLESAFRLDFKERNYDAKWTRQANAYVSDRMRDVSAYAGSAEQAARASGRSGRGVPPGDNDLTIPLFPPEQPDRGPAPEPDRDYPPSDDFGSSPCEQLSELCIALYAAVTAAQLRDTYTDQIASVEPNCICSSFNPNQTFIARPQQGRPFQTPLPMGVFLHFRGQIITPLLVSPSEIHFKIPADARTGFVNLRALGSLPSQASRSLASACALAMPEIPSEILYDRSPAALISIIFPPVIDSLTSDAGQQPAEACTPVEIRWHVHLLDQPVSAPIHPCGSIEVILRDEQGNQVVAGGASGSVLETRSDTTTFTLEAVSRAGQHLCGTAAPVSLTVARVRSVRLERDPATGTEHQGGIYGRFVVRISCDAPAGGQIVELTSSDAAVLQVPSPVTIPAGANSLPVDFTTIAACTAAPIRITAASPGHTSSGSLEFQIYDVPVLQWTMGPPAVQEGGPFSAEVNASCVPDSSARVNWWLINTDPNSQQLPLALSAQRTAGQYPALRFRVDLSRTSASGLVPGNWELIVEIPDRANPRSQGLAFAVAARPRFSVSLSSLAEETVQWDQEAIYSLVVMGENIPSNVNANVAITTQGLPAGIQVTPSPVTLTQANSGQQQNSTLRLRSPVAIAPLGAFPFRIRASAGSIQAPPQIAATLTVKHQQGPFTMVQLLSNSTPCGSIVATVGGNGMTRTVTFSIPTPNRVLRPTLPAVFFAISPQCRVGVVIPPVTTGIGPTALDLRNLGFEATTGAEPLGNSILTTQIFWQRFWFSPDDSLLVIIGREMRGLPTATHFASLYDMITGRRLAHATFAPAIIQSADDPSPLAPPAWMTGTAYAVDDLVTQNALTYRCLVAHTSGTFALDLADGKWAAEFLGETEIQLAVITGIVLVNGSNGDFVIVDFTDPNGVADSLTLHL